MFFVNLDLSDLDDILAIGDVAKDELSRATASITAATHAKVVELANERLHSRRSMYLDGLSHFELEPGVFVVNLDASVRWIDDGMSAHSMLDALLKSKKAKRAKDGSTYVVVPFQLNKTKQDMTPAQQSLLQTVKKELAKVGATPNKIETYASGAPKLGLVRALDITDAPKSKSTLRIGGGPLGSVAQGTTGGTPLLKGVRIYQQEAKRPDGSKGVNRYVMTFRVASSKQEGGGKWEHPGTPATNLMDSAYQWALETWESKIAPDLVSKITAKLG